MYFIFLDEFKREILLPQGALVKQYRRTFSSDGLLTVDIPVQSQTSNCEDAPRPFTSKDKIKEIYFALQNAKRPLLVIGKGICFFFSLKQKKLNYF